MTNKLKIEENSRKSLNLAFSDHLSDNQWCEVVEWTNGEGMDVFYEDKSISITFAEFNALSSLGSMLNLS